MMADADGTDCATTVPSVLMTSLHRGARGGMRQGVWARTGEESWRPFTAHRAGLLAWSQAASRVMRAGGRKPTGRVAITAGAV
jgi:hypothetical protein